MGVKVVVNWVRFFIIKFINFDLWFCFIYYKGWWFFNSLIVINFDCNNFILFIGKFWVFLIELIWLIFINNLLLMGNNVLEWKDFFFIFIFSFLG